MSYLTEKNTVVELTSVGAWVNPLYIIKWCLLEMWQILPYLVGKL